MSPIRQVGQPQAQETRFVQFVVRGEDYGEQVHIQARGRGTNRGYGGAANVGFDTELGGLLGGLHQAGVLPEATSLATSKDDYVRMEVRRNGGSFIFSAEADEAPIFAYRFWNRATGRVEFEVDGDELPASIRDALS